MELLVRGVSKREIARRLGVNRGTVLEWTHHPEFVRALNERLDEERATIRLRRLHTTTRFTDAASNMATRSLQRALERDDDDSSEKARSWLGEYREMRGAERAEFGDDVQRVELRADVRHSGSISTRPFKAVLLDAIERGAVDVNEVNRAATPMEALIIATTQLLQNTDILLEIDREDEERIKALNAGG